MPAVLSPPTRTVRHNVTWEEFERLCAENGDGRVRHAYSDGTLEVTVPSLTHEDRVSFIHAFVAAMAEGTDLEYRAIGSTTIKRGALRKSVEPDGAYYVHSEPRVRGKAEIDFTVDPPDIVVEVDVTNDSMEKLPLFASLRIPEVWRCTEDRAEILLLRGDRYVPGPSATWPVLDSATLTRFMLESLAAGRVELTRRIRRWARDQK